MISVADMMRHIDRIPEVFKARTLTSASTELTKRYLLIGNQKYPLQVPLLGGGVLTLNNWGEVQVFWHIFIRNCYWVPSECRTIVDVGANIGLFSIWAARKTHPVAIWAVEPSPGTHASLVKNVRDNRMDGVIRCFQQALGGEKGERRMATAADSPHHTLLDREARAPDAGTVPVPCTTLPEFLESNSIDRVDLLKMDIEGCEYEVLRATPPPVLQRIRNMVIEYHDYMHNSPRELFAYLEDTGFQVTILVEDSQGTGLARLERPSRPL